VLQPCPCDLGFEDQRAGFLKVPVSNVEIKFAEEELRNKIEFSKSRGKTEAQFWNKGPYPKQAFTLI